MKAKKLAALGLCLSCASAMIAGCSSSATDTASQTGSTNSNSIVDVNEDSGSLSLDAVQSVNNPISLLQKYNTVSISAFFTDETGNETTARTMQYTRDDDGYFQSFLHSHFNIAQATDADADFYSTSYASKTTPGAIYALYNGETNMTCYPTDEYEQFASEQFICWLSDADETVESVEDKDGLKVLKSQSTYGDESSYYVTTYNMDPSSLVLQSLDVQCFLKDNEGDQAESQPTSAAHYDFYYDRDYLPEKDVSQLAIGDASEKCHLTITVDPDSENEEVQAFDVKRGTEVFFNSNYFFDAFDDEKMKEPLESADLDTSTDQANYFIKFTNK